MCFWNPQCWLLYCLCCYATYWYITEKARVCLYKSFFNSHAVGMAVARPLGFEIDFVRNPFSESAVRFFLIFLKFIFTPIFEIRIQEKNSLKLRD